MGSYQHAQDNWFAAFIIVFIAAAVLINIWRARAGKQLYIRRIPGLDAIDEAIGRSTELGRPVTMIPGLTAFGVEAVQALTIFKYITKQIARFATPMRLLTANPTVYAVAQEAISDAYNEAGRPDLYDPDSIRFLSSEQFAFASGVAGLLQRERVAANFMFGIFFAESLIFAETGNIVGAVQIAGTVSFTQVPFFVAACDYTIIGDEFYATSAYISREPVLLGSMVGQDLAKLAFGSLVVGGAVLSTILGPNHPVIQLLGKPGGWEPFMQWLSQVLGRG
ncbi:MAG: hypothetical protein NZ874_08700 [Fimbriimonadales bacterium]|nr:hypothetical protein [Fimbriimonadales bacterium]